MKIVRTFGILICALIIVSCGDSDNSQFTRAASNSVAGKLNAESNSIQLLLSEEGVERTKVNAFVSHVERVRIARLNSTSLQQTERAIPEQKIFSDMKYLTGSRVDSSTGQEFRTYRVVHTNTEDTRMVLLPRVSEYGGWCYINIDDALLCEFPKRVVGGQGE